MADLDKRHALDHVVVALFENRSFDNVLGRLYGPGDAKSFAGVLDKDLSNPIPEWAEHGADRKVVPYGVTTDMDSPNPDSGEEYFHTKPQLFNTMDGHNRLKIGEGATEPWNAPPSGATPTMDGFVTDYISTFTGEVGRQPTYDEYAQIMTGYTPEQLPVLSAIARDFGVFDHWFSEVPSQTFMNEYRHTSLIATLRKVWGLGQAFTRRDASSRTFDQVFALDKPRDPERWVAGRGAGGARLDDRRPDCRGGIEHPGQGDRPGHHRPGQANGHGPAIGTDGRRSRVHSRAAHPVSPRRLPAPLPSSFPNRREKVIVRASTTGSIC